MQKRIMIFLTYISVLATLACILGIGFVFAEENKRSLESQPLQQTSIKKQLTPSTIHVVALGDSLTRGLGDKSGKGYIGYAVDELKKKTGKKVALSNAAINGQTSTELLQQLKQKEIQRQISHADVVVFTIGGNDLFGGGNILSDLSKQSVEKVEQPYLKNLKQIYTTLRQYNNKAPIFHIGLYNPFSDMDQEKLTSELVTEWNIDTAKLAAGFDQIVFVPTFDLFQLHVNDYLFNDHFHPNTEGYKLIGERVASLITYSKEEDK